jgi:hypothetical protein
MLSDIEADGTQDDIIFPSVLPFLSVHLACFAAIWSGVTWQSVVLCASLYWLRICAIGAGYHRYFSHHAYSTSRAFQFVLAFLSQTSAQKSVLWWAAKHRQHHCTPIPRETCIRRGVTALSTVIWGGFSFASTAQPTSRKLLIWLAILS